MLLLKFAHIALAVFAVGTNFSFPIWIRLAERDGSDLVFTLNAVRWIDRHVTIPAYGLVALTGLTMAWLDGFPLTTFWLAGAIVLFVAIMAAGFFIYAPVSRRRLAGAVRAGASDPDYRWGGLRGALLDLFIIPAVLVILGLMVLKPGL